MRRRIRSEKRKKKERKRFSSNTRNLRVDLNPLKKKATSF